MIHVFTISLIGKNIATEVDNIKSAIVAKGGKFEGDISSGKFSGSGVEGYYSVLPGDQFEITITKKPFIAPMSLVESKIRSYFS